MSSTDQAPQLIVISERLGALGEPEQRIVAAGGAVTSAPLWNRDDIEANGAEASILLVGAVEPFDAAALKALPKCIGIVRRGVGYDNIDVDAATELGVLIANVPDATVEDVSDHALALLLSTERHVPALHAAVRGGVWQRDPSGIAAIRKGMRRLGDLTLGIVGFGRIGRALGRKAAGIYGTVLVADPLTTPEAAAELGFTLVPLSELLARADHVSLHAPLTDDTRHLLNAQTLACMKSDALIVNTSRGALVDEQALLSALAAGRLGAASLDVTEKEPIPEGDPLLTAERVVLTGHSAATSVRADVVMRERAIDAVVALLSGQLPASVVNPSVLDAPAWRGWK